MLQNIVSRLAQMKYIFLTNIALNILFTATNTHLKGLPFWAWHGCFAAGCPVVGTASVYGYFESTGGNGAGRGAPWDGGPLGGGGGAVGVGVEAGPVGASPVYVAGAAAGAKTDGIVKDHGAGAAAIDPEYHKTRIQPE